VLFAAVSVATAAVALVLTWRRLFIGMDLQDESYYILVPWRWALGDKPFIDEENLAQVAGFLEYPFIKVFEVLRGGDVTGLVLYGRHLYLVLMLLVATAVFLALRRLVRWELALPVAVVYVTYIFWETPQLSYNTMAGALLSLGAALGVWVVVHGGGRRWAFGSGLAFGLAVVAYPTLLFVMPFVAVFLALSLGARSVRLVSHLFSERGEPDAPGPPTGRTAWIALSAWVGGGLTVLVPIGLYMLSFGLAALERSLSYTMAVAESLDQLGGAPKAYEVTGGFWRFMWSAPYLLVAALLVYLVYLRWPRTGRVVLALVPLALWRAGQHAMLDSAGFAIVYAFMAPYLYLFVPRRWREAGARLLYWVWVPALLAGAMTAFTSAAGYLNGAVGFLPALMVSGVFLAWSLESVTSPEEEPPRATARSSSPGTEQGPLPWLALAALCAVVLATLVFQFQFQQREVPYASLTERFDSGPWWGIAVTPERYAQMNAFAADLSAQTRPGDRLLIFYQSPGYYLFWPGDISANSYWLANSDTLAPLPQSTVDFYRRNHVVPTVAVHLLVTEGMSDARLAGACGGLGYPPVLVRPRYSVQRKPIGKTTGQVLAGLPAE
jgi:hypothetical protein